MNKQRLLELAGLQEAQYAYKKSFSRMLAKYFEQYMREGHYRPKEEFVVFVDGFGKMTISTLSVEFEGDPDIERVHVNFVGGRMEFFSKRALEEHMKVYSLRRVE